MLYRSIQFTHEAIRHWCFKFAQTYANQLRRSRPQPADKWQPCGFVKIRISSLKLLGKGQQPFITQESLRVLSSILLDYQPFVVTVVTAPHFPDSLWRDCASYSYT